MSTSTVFSGGTGRSGTTVISNLLGRHPDVLPSRPHEVRFVTDPAGILDACYGLDEDAPRRATKQVTRIGRQVTGTRAQGATGAEAFRAEVEQTWWDRTRAVEAPRGLYLGIERETLDRLVDDFVRDFPDDPELAAQAFVQGYIRGQRGFAGQRLWVDTTPRNIESAHRIRRLLPEARFIHMVRDGRDTAASVIRQRWGPSEPIQALRWWAKRLQRAWRGGRDLPESAFITVHLEDLVVHRREETLARLLGFLDLDEAPRLRRFFEQRMTADRVGGARWRTEVPDPAAFEAEYQRLAAKLISRGLPADLVRAEPVT